MAEPDIERTRYQQFVEGLMLAFFIITLLGIFFKVMVL